MANQLYFFYTLNLNKMAKGKGGLPSKNPGKPSGKGRDNLPTAPGKTPPPKPSPKSTPPPPKKSS